MNTQNVNQNLFKTKSPRGARANWLAMTLFPLTLPLTIAAYADGNEGRYELTPYAGQNMFEDKQNLEDATVYGLRLGYYVTDNFEWELAAGFVSTNVDDTTLIGSVPGRYRSPTDDVDVLFYNIDALYNFSNDSRFTPYLVAGVGRTHYKPSISTKDMATLNAGLGFKFAFNDNLALRLDVRDYYVGELFQESFNNIQTTLGLAFTFGSKARRYEDVNAPTPVILPAPEPKPVPTETAPVVVTQPKDMVLEFQDVHFNFDQSTLTPEARKMLQQKISTLKSNPKTKVRISGYTSASGSDEYNMALSERRADAVENYLISEGISASRLSSRGYGESNPAQPESNPDDKYSTAAKANMRALFEVIINE